jgi:hypothetical protein
VMRIMMNVASSGSGPRGGVLPSQAPHWQKARVMLEATEDFEQCER